MAEELDLGPIEERLGKITPVPWQVDESECCVYGDGENNELVAEINRGWGSEYPTEANAHFIANAPADISALIAEIKRLREQSLKDRQAFTSLQTEMATGGDNS